MRINIVDVISRYVTLRKLGPGYTGVCPFCGATGMTDFRVSVLHQQYTCEKCGASGGVFQFLLSLKHISLEEALKEVRETFNISLNSHLTDIRWNELLRGTDFQQVLRGEVKKAATVFEDSDWTEERRFAEKKPVTYTELATFIRCPLEYRLRFRDKIKIYEPIGTGVNVGRFLHRVASQFFKQPVGGSTKQFIESMLRRMCIGARIKLKKSYVLRLKAKAKALSLSRKPILNLSPPGSFRGVPQSHAVASGLFYHSLVSVLPRH